MAGVCRREASGRTEIIQQQLDDSVPPRLKSPYSFYTRCNLFFVFFFFLKNEFAGCKRVLSLRLPRLINTTLTQRSSFLSLSLCLEICFIFPPCPLIHHSCPSTHPTLASFSPAATRLSCCTGLFIQLKSQLLHNLYFCWRKKLFPHFSIHTAAGFR